MAAGLGLASTLGASIAAYFVEQERHAEMRELSTRLERIERLLKHMDAARSDEAER